MTEIKFEYVRKAIPSKIILLGAILTILGGIMLAAAFSIDLQRASFVTIIAMMFIMGVGLASLFLVALEFLVGAVWSTPFRRVSEILALMIFVTPLLAIPLLLNMHSIFEWTHSDVVQADPFLINKIPYLNEPFFLMRTIGVFVVMGFFYFLIISRSQKQDKTKDASLTRGLVRRSGLFMPFFAICATVFGLDWLMTLEPHWFSTIFGVYYFAGSLLTALALLTFISITLAENGYLSPKIKRDHYYNMGALMFAFTNFWAYIAFSQLILIWYANIPEETFWFLDKWKGAWMYVSIGLIVVKFAVPYALLLSQPSKSDPKRLKFASIWILTAHLYDLYWVVMPTYGKHVDAPYTAHFGWIELAAPILIVGLLILVFSLAARGKNLLPIGDPKLQRGLNFHL